MLATSYLPRRWPAKYCHRCESFRPCSGWEREFSSLLVTSEFFRDVHSKLHRILSSISLLLLDFPACQILDLFARFAFASLATAVFLNLHSHNLLASLSWANSIMLVSFILLSWNIALRFAVTHFILLSQNIRSLAPRFFEFRSLRSLHSTQIPLGKALVRLVTLDWKCCHSYICVLSTR